MRPPALPALEPPPPTPKSNQRKPRKTEKKKKEKTKQENKQKKQNKIKYKSLFAESVPPVSSLGVGTRQATVGSGGQRPRTPRLTPSIFLNNLYCLFFVCFFSFFFVSISQKVFYFFCCRAEPSGSAWLRCLVGRSRVGGAAPGLLLGRCPAPGRRGPAPGRRGRRDPRALLPPVAPDSGMRWSGREPSADCGTHSWVAVSCLLLKDIPGRQVPRGAGAIGTGG